VFSKKLLWDFSAQRETLLCLILKLGVLAIGLDYIFGIKTHRFIQLLFGGLMAASGAAWLKAYNEKARCLYKEVNI
jgi:hypothetical protein